MNTLACVSFMFINRVRVMHVDALVVLDVNGTILRTAVHINDDDTTANVKGECDTLPRASGLQRAVIIINKCAGGGAMEPVVVNVHKSQTLLHKLCVPSIIIYWDIDESFCKAFHT